MKWYGDKVKVNNNAKVIINTLLPKGIEDLILLYENYNSRIGKFFDSLFSQISFDETVALFPSSLPFILAYILTKFFVFEIIFLFLVFIAIISVVNNFIYLKFIKNYLKTSFFGYFNFTIKIL